jgi:competence transcription factor ComK
MNKILIFSLFLFSVTFFFSQNHIENIEWKKPILLDDGVQSFVAPNFEGVHYDNGLPKIFIKKKFKGSSLSVNAVTFSTANALQSEIDFLAQMDVRVLEQNPLDIKFTKSAHEVFLVIS